jgi:hypothetical protein
MAKLPVIGSLRSLISILHIMTLDPIPSLPTQLLTSQVHLSVLARRQELGLGFNTTRILDPLFALNDICEVDESPLECELRQHKPSFAILSLGTNQIWAADVFESELRQIVEICIAHGVLPILSTKGDNLEGDHRINAIITRIASEYDVPLWNFWQAIQSLPEQGLQADKEHLTWAENNFADPAAMTHAWPVRNLTALRVLETLKYQLAPEGVPSE